MKPYLAPQRCKNYDFPFVEIALDAFEGGIILKRLETAFIEESEKLGETGKDNQAPV